MLELFSLKTTRYIPKRPARGFSIIELVIAIAISAILLGLAVPSFINFLNSNRVTTQANELLASFQTARMEAIRRNARVIVCASNDADAALPTCAAGSTWNGWIVHSDANGDGVINADEVIKVNSLAAPIQADSSTNIDSQVVFRPDGFARTAAGALLEGTVAICLPTTTPAENARDVVIDAGSRIGVTKRNGGGNCNTPAN